MRRKLLSVIAVKIELLALIVYIMYGFIPVLQTFFFVEKAFVRNKKLIYLIVIVVAVIVIITLLQNSFSHIKQKLL